MALQHDFHRRMIFKMNPEGRCVDTPSGPQWAFNEDQARLAELLYLSNCVSDFVIAPAIGTYQQNPCAALFDLYSSHLRLKGLADTRHFDMYSRYLIILQTEDGPTRESLDMIFIQNWCGEHRTKAYLVPAANLQGTVLGNARRLSRACRVDPDAEGEGMSILLRLLKTGDHTVAEAMTAMMATGDSEAKVRRDIERAVANQFAVFCDLTVPFTDQSILKFGNSIECQNFNLDPVMAIITSGDELW